ncbi:helix-turn-helix transcriptional regulator [Vibrio splendidus]|nr:helix-turn-helix transcriptional regulator [Vibrio splendidus]
MTKSPVIGKRIKNVRKSLNLTQVELGRKIGMNDKAASSRISHYEQATHYPPYEFIIALSKLSQFPISYFYEDNEELASSIQILYNLSHGHKKLIFSVISELKDRDCAS